MNIDKIIEIIISSLTVLVSTVSAVSVVLLSRQQSKQAKIDRRQAKQNSWYRSEVISENKLRNHIDVEIRNIILNDKLDKKQMCTEINTAMLSFFYRSVNYMAFFNLKHYNALKQKIMAETDNLMYNVLIESGKLSEQKADKALEIYRMKLIYLFYDYEMKFDK